MATEQSIKTPTELQAMSYMTCTTNSGEGHCNKPGFHSYPIGCYLYRLTTASSNPTITFHSWDATISSTLRRATSGWVRGFTFIHVMLYIVSLHTAKCFLLMVKIFLTPFAGSVHINPIHRVSLHGRIPHIFFHCFSSSLTYYPNVFANIW